MTRIIAYVSILRRTYHDEHRRNIIPVLHPIQRTDHAATTDLQHMGVFLAGSFLLVAADACIIYCAWCRRNCARIVLLGLALLFLLLVSVSHFMCPTEWGGEDLWSNETLAVCAIMDAITIYWLFTGAGARWYATK